MSNRPPRPRIIDAFTHVRPSAFLDRAESRLGGAFQRTPMAIPALDDVDLRVRNMDEDGIDQQVITYSIPPIEQITTDPAIADDLVDAANAAILAMANTHPDRIIPVGVVAMLDGARAARQAEKCLHELGMRGILIFTNANGRFLHDPELQPFFEYMHAERQPIWLHPYYNPRRTLLPFGIDFNIDQVFGWPLETAAAMTCLIYGGVLDRFPNLTFITHHAGASIPVFDQRIQTHPGGAARLPRPLLDYYRGFYVDSAVQGSPGGMLAACSFYGPGHLLFGTDTPMADPTGKGNARATLASIEQLPVSAEEKRAIFGGNLLQLLDGRA